MKAKFNQNLKQYLIEINEQVYRFLEENVTPFSAFCQEHGLPIRIAPKNISEYMSYIYWCKANDLIALGGESDRNELEAYYIAVENFIAWDRHKFSAMYLTMKQSSVKIKLPPTNNIVF